MNCPNLRFSLTDDFVEKRKHHQCPVCKKERERAIWFTVLTADWNVHFAAGKAVHAKCLAKNRKSRKWMLLMLRPVFLFHPLISSLNHSHRFIRLVFISQEEFAPKRQFCQDKKRQDVLKRETQVYQFIASPIDCLLNKTNSTFKDFIL